MCFGFKSTSTTCVYFVSRDGGVSAVHFKYRVCWVHCLIHTFFYFSVKNEGWKHLPNKNSYIDGLICTA